jgi:hypothetical protein
VVATDVLYDISKLKPLLQSAYSALSSSSETTTSSRLIFVLFPVPRACYNPLVEDLDKYITEMANGCGFSLHSFDLVKSRQKEKTLTQTDPTTSVLKDSLSLRDGRNRKFRARILLLLALVSSRPSSRFDGLFVCDANFNRRFWQMLENVASMTAQFDCLPVDLFHNPLYYQIVTAMDTSQVLHFNSRMIRR